MSLFSTEGPGKGGMIGIIVFLAALTAGFLFAGLDQLPGGGPGALAMVSLAGAMGTVLCVYVGLLVTGISPSDFAEDHPLPATCFGVALCLFVCVGGVFLVLAGHLFALVAAIGAPIVAAGLIVRLSRSQ